MLKYMLRRVLQMIPVLFIITIITFLFVNASGDPTRNAAAAGGHCGGP